MSGLVTVVCRHNQARSVMAAAALRRFFPNLEVVSAGIAAVEGQRIPESILNLADLWGLQVTDPVSHSLVGVQEQLLSSNFIVVAEDEFISNIVDMGIPPERILSMQDQSFDHAFIPFDPIGQGNQTVSVEIAKAIMTTIQLSRGRSDVGHSHPVQVVFTIDESDFQDKLKRVWSTSAGTNGGVVLADFRAPNFQAISQICEPVLGLTLNRLDQTISISDSIGGDALERALASSRPFAISGRFEMDQAEKFVLSAEFIRLVTLLAKKGPVSILTEPLGLGPCAYLVGAIADIG